MTEKRKPIKHPLFESAHPAAEELIKYIRKIEDKHLRLTKLGITLAGIITNCTETLFEAYTVLTVVKMIIDCSADML